MTIHAPENLLFFQGCKQQAFDEVRMAGRELYGDHSTGVVPADRHLAAARLSGGGRGCRGIVLDRRPIRMLVGGPHAGKVDGKQVEP